MKIVKFCLFPVFLFLAAVMGLGYFAPDGWDVSVSAEIDAPPEAIHPFIDELARWESWMQLSENENAQFTFTFEGPARGVGAIANSKGPGSNVRWEITASDPQKGVWFDELLEGEAQAKGAIMFEAQGETTKVTWVDKGSLGTSPFVRYFHPVMEKALGAAYVRNLAGLKKAVENAAVDQ